MAYVHRRRRGGEGVQRKSKQKKKKDMDRKQGQKPHRIAPPPRVGGACSFSAFSIHPSRLRDHRRRAGPVPQIQTNSSGSYRRSNKCRTFTFSSEGSATVSPPPPSHQPPVRSPPHRNPRAFRRCLFFSSCSAFPSSLAFPLADRAR